MSTVKVALLSISAAMLVLCLGLFSTASADRHATSDAPAVTKVTAPAQQSVKQTTASCSSEPAAALTLQMSSSTSSIGGSDTAVWCPVNTVYTCCRCGGCGCRPTNMSPTNWCGC